MIESSTDIIESFTIIDKYMIYMKDIRQIGLDTGLNMCDTTINKEDFYNDKNKNYIMGEASYKYGLIRYCDVNLNILYEIDIANEWKVNMSCKIKKPVSNEMKEKCSTNYLDCIN